jgi:hypothetical protein
MPKVDLRQDYRAEDGKLYRRGKGVEVPASLAKAVRAAPAARAAEETPAGATVDALADVELTPAAKTRAQEEGLTAEDFKRQRKSGATGFTVEDVESIAERKNAQ